MNRAEVERLMAAYDARLTALTSEIDGLRREVVALKRAGASRAPAAPAHTSSPAYTNASTYANASAHNSAPASNHVPNASEAGALTISRKEAGALVATTVKAAIAGAVDMAVARATESTRREMEPRIGAMEAALSRTMTHLAYKTDDVETMTHNYQMAALNEAEGGGNSRRAIGDLPGPRGNGRSHDIIPGAVRLAFTDDD